MPTITFGKYEWDSHKDEVNKNKYGISLEAAAGIFSGKCVEAQQSEKSAIAIGVLPTKETVVVFIDKGENRKIIAARRAKENERQAYKKFLERRFD
jgi:uncharacterized DUF497 family protein